MTKRQQRGSSQSQRALQNQPGNTAGRTNQNQALTRVQMEQHFTGPLPPPEFLAGYDEIVPGTAEKIINRFIEQGSHRMELEKLVVKGSNKRANWGLVAGFVVAMTTIVGAIYAMSLGYDVAGAAVVIASLASLVGTFLYGTKSRRDERVEKSKL